MQEYQVYEQFERPFPALTPRQRVHLDVYGYVVIPNTLSAAEVARLTTKMYELEEVYRRCGELPGNAQCLNSDTRELFRIDNLPHLDPCFFDYVTHPYLVGLAEEAIGGPARLEQSDAHIHRPPADKAAQSYSFHRGAGAHFTWTNNGLYQCYFVKTLTNLTDLGPDDGGTTVIAGSHKMLNVPSQILIEAAQHDPALIHQVIAPAGSTLLFFESLLHSSGIMRSNNERLLIVAGYTPAMLQPWEGYDLDPEFVAQVPEKFRPLLTGSTRYIWHRKEEPVNWLTDTSGWARDLSTPSAWPGNLTDFARSDQ